MIGRGTVWRWLGPASLAAVAGAGCGPGDEKDDGGSTAASPEAELVAALCDGLEGCCSSQSMAFDRVGCEGQAVLALSARQPASAEAVLDPAAADACAAEIRQAISSCGATPTRGACDRVYVGTRATGEACAEPSDCAPVTGAEVFCSGVCRVDRRVGAGAACVGTCRELACELLPELAATDPVDRAYCSLAQGLACVNRTCAPAPTAGQPCAGTFCAEGAQCAADSTCIAQAAIGAPCSDAPCVPEAHCSSGVCVALLPSGAACETNGDCESEYCDLMDDGMSRSCRALPGAGWDAAACAGSPDF